MPFVLRGQREHQRGEPDAVAVQLLVQVLDGLAVPVVHDCARLEADLPAAPQRLDEHRQVLAAAGGGAGAEGVVEAADGLDQGSAVGHVRAGAVRADAVDGEVLEDLAGRGDRSDAGVPHGALDVVGDDRDGRERALGAEPAVVRLVPDLRRGGEFARQDDTGDGVQAGLADEPGPDGAEPLRVDADVVVGEGDDVAGRGGDAGVPAGGQAGAALLDQADVPPGEHRGQGVAGGDADAVVDEDDLVPRVVEVLEDVEQPAEVLDAVDDGGHDDRDGRQVVVRHRGDVGQDGLLQRLEGAGRVGRVVGEPYVEGAGGVAAAVADHHGGLAGLVGDEAGERGVEVDADDTARCRHGVGGVEGGHVVDATWIRRHGQRRGSPVAGFVRGSAAPCVCPPRG
nr:hypothetical protein N8D75_13425 [Curtobacterium flaccumfaciens]